MLRQLRRVCGFDAFSSSLLGIGCRPSIIGLRPIHGYFLRVCSHRRVHSDSPAAAAAAKDPRWVTLNLQGCRADDSALFAADDAKTVAETRTSTGRQLRVSFRRAAPPASSFLYYDFPADSAPAGDDEDEDDYEHISVDVVSAHTDSVLLQTSNQRYPSDFEEDDNFVYSWAGAAGPPSLSLLPARDFLTRSETVLASYQVRPPVRPTLYRGSTGLLRRGEHENDLFVVQLQLWYDRDARRHMAEFCVLRPSTGKRQQWELMDPVPIVRQDEGDKQRVLLRSGNAVIPVGDRYLCWVNYENGFFLCDMADKQLASPSPMVRYAPLPAEVSGRCGCIDCDDDVFRIKYSMRMGSAGVSKVRFVSVDPRCCCGGPGRSTCAHSRFAFTVKAWTMDLTMDESQAPLTWVKDTEIDCEEVWALPGYEDDQGIPLPRANLQCPVVSLDNPNVVCFLVSNAHFTTNEDRKVWMIQLNIRTKTLLSVVHFSNDPWSAYHHLPAQLQN